MLNLLIISDNIKAESIMSRLQPMLRAKIDILGDFDLGLKEVFEKRPVAVIIQDQIGGVSAENVARHIQMLLRANAPKFVLMHAASPSVKPVSGVFDHVIDLNMPAREFLEALLTMLKTICGEQWTKVYIAPVSPEPLSEAADRLADELFSGLHVEAVPAETVPAETTGNSDQSMPEGSLDENKSVYLATMAEEITALLGEQINESSLFQRAEETVDVKKTKKPSPAKSGIPFKKKASSVTGTVQDFRITNGTKKHARFSLLRKIVGKRQSGTSPAALQPKPPELTKTTEDILLSFERNYRAASRQWKKITAIALIIVALAAGGLYLLSKNTQGIFFGKETPLSTEISAPTPDAPAPTGVVANLAGNLQKPMSSAATFREPAGNSLPSFIPSENRDQSFTAGKPGWERYMDSEHDFRLFRSDGRIKAMQVLAVKGHPITGQFLKSVLKEFWENPQLKLLSRRQLQDVAIQAYKVNAKGDLLIYRNKTTNDIIAFVVSPD